MRARRWWPFCIAAGAAIAAVVVATRRDPDGPSRGTDAREPERDAEATGRPPAALARAPSEPSRPTGRSILSGDVTRDGRPVEARIEVFAGPSFADPAESATRRASQWTQRFLRSDPPAPLAAETTSSIDGVFVVRGLAPGMFALRATDADGASGAADAAISVDGERGRVRIELRPAAGTLAGRVVDAEGRAFRCRVRLLPEGRGPDSAFVPIVDTDEDGRFVARGLPASRMQVLAFRPDELSFSWGSPAPDDAGERTFALPPLRRVDGRIVSSPADAPVPGALLVAGPFSIGEGSLTVSATSDAAGAFVLAWPLGATATLDVSAAGFAPTSAWAFPADAVVRLRRAATLVGRVLRADDRTPVAGMSVVAFSTQGSLMPIASARTDRQGQYSLPSLPAAELRLHVEGAGMRAARRSEGGLADVGEAVFVRLSAGAATTIDVPVLPGASVRGVVFDARGAPVEAAIVEAVPTRGDTAILYALGRYFVRGVATDAQGRFEMDGLAPDVRFALSAKALGHRTAWAGPLTGTSSPDSIVIRFPASRRVVVTVVDAATGSPIPRVMVQTIGQQQLGERSLVWTDTGGRAAFEAEPLDELRASVGIAPGYVMPAETTIAKDANEATVRLTRGAAIGGVVVGEDGRPSAGAWVAASSTRAGGPSAQTDANGRFRLDGLEAGTWKLTAQRHDAVPEVERGEVEATTGASDVVVRLTAAERHRLQTVRVLDPAGNAVAFANARVLGPRSFTTSVGHGVVTLPLDDRSRTVEVWGATGADGGSLPLGPARVEVAPGADAQVAMPAEVVIEGRVVRADGAPAARLRVHAAHPDDEVLARTPNGAQQRMASATADAAGAFRLLGLGAREYAIWVEAPDDVIDPPATRVVGGARDATILLRAAVSATVTVVDSKGRPFPRASLGAYVEAHRRLAASAVADEHGVATLARLDPRATYALAAEAMDGGDTLRDWVEPWTPAATRFVLPRKTTIEGRVVDADGAPVVGKTVRLRAVARERQASTRTDRAGAFRLQGVLEGDYLLSVEGDQGELAGVRVPVAGGARDLTVVQPRLAPVVVQVKGCPRDRRGVLLVRDASGREGLGAAVSNEAGEFRFEGVGPDLDVTFFLRGDPADRVPAAWVDGLRAGVETSVEGSAPLAIEGTVTLPGAARLGSVNARRGALHVMGTVGPDGRSYAIDGLTRGDWVVDLGGDGAARASVTARAGARAPDVTLGR